MKTCTVLFGIVIYFCGLGYSIAGERDVEIFHKEIDNRISISAFETTCFPNPNDHADWSKYNNSRFQLKSVKDYRVTFSTTAEGKERTVWTNREFAYANIPGESILQSCTIFDAAAIDGCIDVCYESGIWFRVDTISDHPTNSPPKQIAGTLLARLPVGLYAVFTNANFGTTSNGVPTLVASGTENITAAWIYQDHNWVVNAAACNPSSITNQLRKEGTNWLYHLKQ